MKREPFTLVLTAVGLAISGASLAAGVAQAAADSNYRVLVMLEIVNLSKWPLTSPNTYTDMGVIKLQPRTVRAGYKEMMVMRKANLSLLGSAGSVSWMVNNKEVVVMWFAPFGFNCYPNKLAVGIAPQGTHGRGTFDEMREGQETYFERRGYDDNIGDVVKCDDSICIRGSMGNTHRPEVLITVYPKDESNLSGNIKEEMNIN